VRVAVARVGYWGPNLVRNFVDLPSAEVVRICDTRPGPLGALQARYPGLQRTTRFGDLLEDRSVEAIAVSIQAEEAMELRQNAVAVAGRGLELVITLGSGVGTGLFQDGRLAPHLEIAHHPFRKGDTYNEQLGEAARERLSKKKWNSRVKRAVDTLDALLFFDHVYLGGGNSVRVTVDLGPKASIVDNSAGILGGIKLWVQPSV